MKAEKVLLIFFFDQRQPAAQMKKACQIFLSNLPEIKLITNYEVEFLFAKKEKEGWQKLASLIYKNYQNYTGFVVYSDYKKVLFPADILSFVFQNLSKPIVFTGAKSEKLTPAALDVKSNLINSFQVARSALAEVCLVFGNKILRPTRSFYDHDSDLNLFDCHKDGLIGRIDFGISFFNAKTDFMAKKNDKSGQLGFAPAINDRVSCLDYYPFTDLNLIKNLQSDGLVIKGGFLDEQAAELIHSLGQKIVLYQSQGDPGCQNCVSVQNGTLEAVLAKLMWCLGQTKELKIFRQMFCKEITGEWGGML